MAAVQIMQVNHKTKLLAALIAAAVFSCSKPEYQVTFNMNSPTLRAETTVYLEGAHEALGNGQPRAVTMNYAGNQVWTISLAMSAAETFEYRYTLDSSDPLVPAVPSGQPLPPFRTEIDGNLTISDRVPDWTEAPTPDAAESDS